MQVANTIKFLSAVTIATFGVVGTVYAADLPEHATVTVDGGKTTVNTESHVATPKGSVHTTESASQKLTPTDDGVAEEVTEESTTTAVKHNDDELPSDDETPAGHAPTDE